MKICQCDLCYKTEGKKFLGSNFSKLEIDGDEFDICEDCETEIRNLINIIKKKRKGAKYE